MNLSAEPWPRLLSFSPIATVVVGIVLLLLGRKLFWLFVAAIGFIVGVAIAAEMFPHQEGWVVIAGLIMGVVGAVIAIFVQKIAISIAGFLAGGYFLMTLMRTWEMHRPEYQWISFVVGGLIGAMLMIFVFDWALIVFSSISGAHLITHSFAMTQSMAAMTFAVLFILGLLVQARILAPRRPVEA